MVGLGEAYFSAFILALGKSDIYAGMITTVPLVIGGVLQLFAPRLIPSIGTYKRWVVLLASIQVICLFVLSLFAHVREISVWSLFFVVAIYWTGGLGAVPAWNAWLNSLLPKVLRLKFFSYRSMLASIATISGLVLSGVLLHLGKLYGQTLLVFSIIFFLGGLFRILSISSLLKHSDGEDLVHTGHVSSIRSILGDLRTTHYGKMMIFILIFKFSVYFAAPYFTPFMLLHLKMSYFTYMITIAAASVGSIVVMQYLRGKTISFNADKILFFVVFGVMLNPLLWIISDARWYLVLIQIYSGMLWGVLELCSFLIMFNEIPNSKKATTIGVFSFLQPCTFVLGASCGACFLKYFGSDYQGYIYLLIAGTFIRLLALFFYPKFRETTGEIYFGIATKMIGLRPNSGISHRPIFFERNKDRVKSKE